MDGAGCFTGCLFHSEFDQGLPVQGPSPRLAQGKDGAKQELRFQLCRGLDLRQGSGRLWFAWETE